MPGFDYCDFESPNSGIRSRTGRVKNQQDHALVVRWVAASLLDMEKRFRRIMGYQQLWMLEAKLKDLAEEASVDSRSQVA
jgi:putative transposase